MKMYKCSKCGQVWTDDNVPERCNRCGSSIDDFVETQVYGNSRDYRQESSDEGTVRFAGKVVFVVYFIAGLACFITGCVLADKLSVGIGILTMILGVLLVLTGWIVKAFIRIFANMSERLTSIDNKLLMTQTR